MLRLRVLWLGFWSWFRARIRIRVSVKLEAGTSIDSLYYTQKRDKK